MMSYVVFIQVYNESITKAVYALVDQLLQPYKIIIVDDGTPNTHIQIETDKLRKEFGSNILYYQGEYKKKANLDTVGNSLLGALIWLWSKKDITFDYLSIIDADSHPEPTYYEKLIDAMEEDQDLICTSGDIVVEGKTEKFISAKVIKRNYAQGSGKIIRTNFLTKIPINLFPEVTWDTWINTRAKLAGKKAIQIHGINLHCSRPTTRLAKMDKFRDGRLSYHFGYNPLLILYKIIFRGTDVWKGYRDAKKKKWRLPDESVRKWFGWRYLIHFWK